MRTQSERSFGAGSVSSHLTLFETKPHRTLSGFLKFQLRLKAEINIIFFKTIILIDDLSSIGDDNV